jgi:hypothetical protein
MQDSTRVLGDLSKSNMSYLVMSNFWKQWLSTKSRKKSTDKKVFPKMDKNTSILKYTQSATTSFGSTTPSMAGKPWSEACGSIQKEMDLCLTHDDLVFNDDNHVIHVS